MALPTVYNQIASNRTKTWLIMFLFTVFVCGVVFVFASAFGLDQASASGFVFLAFIFALIMNFASYYWSDKIVMAMSGAKQIQESDAPQLFRTVENLCIADGLPMPKVYIVDDPSPNAFATGRDPKHAAVCATSGILAKLDRLELEGVLAHELSHVKNRDTLVMTAITVLAGMLVFLADWFLRISFFGGGGRDRERNNGAAIFMLIGLVLAILSPIVALLIQMAVSRRRESLADASGALLTRNPEELATALIKISSDPEPMRNASNATAHLFIVNPFKGRSGGAAWLSNLFNTHPPIAERVKALREMEGQVA